MQQLANHVATVLQPHPAHWPRGTASVRRWTLPARGSLQHGSEMHARWRQAVGENAVRHRNLLTTVPLGRVSAAGTGRFALYEPAAAPEMRKFSVVSPRR